MENIPTKEELNPVKKKAKFWTILKTILLFIGPIIIKNQKHIKNTDNEKKVDDAVDILRNL
jgi:hypothetical protein